MAIEELVRQVQGLKSDELRQLLNQREQETKAIKALMSAAWRREQAAARQQRAKRPA